MKLFLSLALFAAFLLCPSACADGSAWLTCRSPRARRCPLFPFFVDKCAARCAPATGRARPSCPADRSPGCTACRPRLLTSHPQADGRLPGRRSDRRRTPATRRAFAKGRCARQFLLQLRQPGFCIRADRSSGLFGSAAAVECCTSCHPRRPAVRAAHCAGQGHTRCVPPFPPFRSAGDRHSVLRCVRAAAAALTVTAFLTVFSILLQLAALMLARAVAQHSRKCDQTFDQRPGSAPLLSLPTGALLTLASFLHRLRWAGGAVPGARNRRAGRTAGGWLCRRQTAAARSPPCSPHCFRLSPAALTALPRYRLLVLFRPLSAALLAAAALFPIWGRKRRKIRYNGSKNMMGVAAVLCRCPALIGVTTREKG